MIDNEHYLDTMNIFHVNASNLTLKPAFVVIIIAQWEFRLRIQSRKSIWFDRRNIMTYWIFMKRFSRWFQDTIPRGYGGDVFPKIDWSHRGVFLKTLIAHAAEKRIQTPNPSNISWLRRHIKKRPIKVRKAKYRALADEIKKRMEKRDTTMIDVWKFIEEDHVFWASKTQSFHEFTKPLYQRHWKGSP